MRRQDERTREFWIAMLYLTIALLFFALTTGNAHGQELVPQQAEQSAPINLTPVESSVEIGAPEYGDFTARYSWQFAKHHDHARFATVDCEYVDRSGVPPFDTSLEQFLGNVLITTQGSRDAFSWDTVGTRFWIDYSADTNAWLVLLSELPNSDKIRVTFDPDCGIVAKIEILSWVR